MIEHNNTQLSVRKQCSLLTVNRSRIYYRSKRVDIDAVAIMNEMRDLYEKCPFYGYRRMHACLVRKGHAINRKRVQRLMKLAGIQAIYPKKNTTKRNHTHAIYPYLLKGLTIDRPNQVWEVDITYIRVRRGFVYLVGIIDIFSRKIIGWSMSVFLDVTPCLEAYENTLVYGKPDILNSDQGCQFTSTAWTSRMIKDGIKVSMDGKGRWADNIYIERFWRSLKYESVFLQSFETVAQAREAIAQYINFYNQERPHQALGYETPDAVYQKYINIPEKEKWNNTKEKSCPTSFVGKPNKNSQIQATFWS